MESKHKQNYDVVSSLVSKYANNHSEKIHTHVNRAIGGNANIRNKVIEVKIMVICESRIAVHALSNAASSPALIVLPDRNSSFSLSKIIIFRHKL